MEMNTLAVCTATI